MILSLALIVAFASPSSCAGTDPALVSVTSTMTPVPGAANRYTLHVTAANLGRTAQRGNVLQSVVITLDGIKNGEKGVPPLGPGQRYTFAYDVLRANDADANTTAVDLHLVVHSPAAATDRCNTNNDTLHAIV